jgi:hypothetical protein
MEVRCSYPEDASIAIQAGYTPIVTNAHWFINNWKIDEDLKIQFSCRPHQNTDSFHSNLADAGSPLVRGVRRRLCQPGTDCSHPGEQMLGGPVYAAFKKTI